MKNGEEISLSWVALLGYVVVCGLLLIGSLGG